MRVSQLVGELGVSHVTIRRDLEALIHDGVLEKVRGGAMLRQSAAAEPAPPQPGPAPAQRTQRTLGVLIPAAYYFRHVVDGIRSVAGSTGGDVRLLLSNYDQAEEPALVRELVSSGCAGLLLAPSVGGDDPEALAYLDDVPVPAVLIERAAPGEELGRLSTVRSAHERGVASAMRHLRDLGHTRVALVSRGESQSAAFVRRGWADAVARHGMNPDVPNITGERLGTGPTWEPGGPASVLDELSAAGVTALLCHGDEDALVLLQHARGHGLSIPEDLSLVAYDDELAGLADPPLTAVAPHKEQVGMVAARLLLDLIAGHLGQTPVHIQIEPQLHVRRTTARPRNA
ncbi:DNA-binding LacI/PurR family transcriptional regulator [Thermocatellispora tengchongensis]|uniref:DNA-binding LacI/PurR family transcriptional regulator n=1 Tax=Thermocatellispora tengchongensis TaxID=1073253 RepID=A0A840PBY3_9ACTN|nr:DNA-binding LacI/PurR family transcriptional regulator [Thermocatellispora tengchongensis]